MSFVLDEGRTACVYDCVKRALNKLVNRGWSFCTFLSTACISFFYQSLRREIFLSCCSDRDLIVLKEKTAMIIIVTSWFVHDECLVISIIISNVMIMHQYQRPLMWARV